MRRNQHSRFSARAFAAAFLFICCAGTLLAQPASPPPPLETREFSINSEALRDNLNGFTNWGIAFLHPLTNYNAGHFVYGGNDRIPASNESINREFAAALRQHFARGGINLDTNLGESIAFDSSRHTVIVTALPAELAVITRAMKDLGRWVPEVNIWQKWLEMPLLAREPDGLEYLDSVGFTNRYISDPAAISIDTTNTIPNPSRFQIIHLTPGRRATVLSTLESRGDIALAWGPEVTAENGREVQVSRSDIGQISSTFPPPPIPPPTYLERFHAGLRKLSGLTDHAGFDFAMDYVPLVSEDENSIQLIKFRLQSWRVDVRQGSNGAGPSTNAIVSFPLPDLTFRDGETVCVANLVTTHAIIDYNPHDPPSIRALAEDHKKKHLLIFLTVTLVNPDGTRYHTNTLPLKAK